MTFPAWAYPIDRYYYGWYGLPMLDLERTDADIKTVVVDRLRDNPSTVDADICVDVKQGVVILGGEVDSALAKRAAGDDAWDIPGVVDVSNQLRPRQARPSDNATGGGATRSDKDRRV